MHLEACLFLSPPLSSPLLIHAPFLVQSGFLNVSALTPLSLNAYILHNFLPSEWFMQPMVSWQPGNSDVSLEWFQALWRWLFKQPAGSLLTLSDWPLLPIQGGKLSAIKQGAPVRDKC
jgi:hypothetical protein